MGLTIVDAMLRGAAIGLLLLLAILFARSARRALSARIGVALTLGGACYVALVALDSVFGFANPWRLPLHLMSLATPALFWPFAAAWCDDEFRWRWHHALFIAATMVSGALSFFLPDPLAGLAIGWRALRLASIALGLRATLGGWSADLVEARRRVRIALVMGVGIAIVWLVLAELLTRGWPPPVGWRVVNAASMLLLAALVTLATVGWRDPGLLAPPLRTGPTPPRAEADDSILLARLDADMRHQRLYRQDGLTITAVAARLGVPEYRLRRAINQGLGARNFNAYLNGFRLDEARAALADPAQRDVPIVTIALDAGFGSLAPFNRAFRAAAGCTPTEYRANPDRIREIDRSKP